MNERFQSQNEQIFERLIELNHQISSKILDLQELVNQYSFDIMKAREICDQIILIEAQRDALNEFWIEDSHFANLN